MAKKMTSRLAGKSALITGATSGVGLATAKLFATEGARVAVAARSGTVDVASSLGDGHIGIDCDVANLQAIRDMTAKVEAEFGGLDILFANAGIAVYKPLADWTEEDVDRIFAINAKGQFFTVQALAPIMNSGGVVILTGSVAAKLGQKNMAVYAASKAVAPVFARVLSADLKDKGVRVLCLTPGPVDTPIFAKGGLDEAAARAKLTEVAGGVPLGRVGRAEELAEGALFLASDASRYMLGAEVVMDGGKSQL